MNPIEVKDLWIKFNVHFYRKSVTLRQFVIQKIDALKPGRTTESREGRSAFWALRGLTFSVERGEVVALLGHNGAGKSTLLLTLAGIYAPDRGQVLTRGSIGTLLSLSAGFDPELTGYENILLYGTFVGWGQKETQAKAAEVAEFAHLDDFIDAPLKTYSSGMRSRLGFSLAIQLDPVVLLIDEILETGDAVFREKTSNLIELYRERGKTIVLASHSMARVRADCTRALLLDHGQIVEDGPPAETIKAYNRRIREARTAAQGTQEATAEVVADVVRAGKPAE